MSDTTRRTLLQGFLALAASPALAQDGAAPQSKPFAFEDVVGKARELAAAPYEAASGHLPDPFDQLDFDAYRDIRFRPDKAFLSKQNSPFRLQLFHLGFLYRRPVTINIIRDGVPAPIPYQSQLFDYGRTKIDKPLPVNMGFAGFRVHYPLNNPLVYDELIAFLGASYFRFLGRDQRYGLSARGIALEVGSNETEEFPRFREFWVQASPQDSGRVVIFALLDGPSIAGAYRFEVYPNDETAVDVTATLFPRRTLSALGLAPLTSMFFTGENDRRPTDDFRPELHDSDGLLMHSGTGEWIWRPLRNPSEKRVSSFTDNNPRGFGLMQQDRRFEDYQDLEALYHLRPGYWVEPQGNWGKGSVELVELPTVDETHDNIVGYWRPEQPYQQGQEIAVSYRIRAIADCEKLHPGGKAINTFQMPPRASGSSAPSDPTERRFIIDFAGGDLAFYLSAPHLVELVPSTSSGTITHTFLIPNEGNKGFRAAIDIKLAPGESTDIRAYLKAGTRALTETWTYPWSAPSS